MHAYTLIQVSQFLHMSALPTCLCTHTHTHTHTQTHALHLLVHMYFRPLYIRCVCVQVVLVSLLWGLKLSPAGMIYPVAIVGLIPIRWLLSRYLFTHTEIEAVSLGHYYSSLCDRVHCQCRAYYNGRSLDKRPRNSARCPPPFCTDGQNGRAQTAPLQPEVAALFEYMSRTATDFPGIG